MLSCLAWVGILARLALAQTRAKSWTGWDCCKPICSNGNLNMELVTSRGMVHVCDKNNKVQDLYPGLFAVTGCANGGTAFLCDSFQPVPVSDKLSYGFAIQVTDRQNEDNPNCCKCYNVTWTSGGAAGKSMVVQILTPGGSGGNVTRNDLIILTPGGGAGVFDGGCSRQYGNNYAWGDVHGGVTSRESCEKLPSNLQGGCYWRWNWARGDLIQWDIQYEQVTCPSRLTDISGCAAKYP